MCVDVKICGLSTFETLDAALARCASHVGFVHFAKSPRHLAIEPMAELARRVAGRADTVIVTVDPDDALLARFAEEIRPDWLQLHGRETPERVAEVKARTGLKVMKALPVAEAGSFSIPGAPRARTCRGATASPSTGGCSMPLTRICPTCFPVGSMRRTSPRRWRSRGPRGSTSPPVSKARRA